MKIGNLLPHALSFYHKVNAGGFFFWWGAMFPLVLLCLFVLISEKKGFLWTSDCFNRLKEEK
jgi:hypothetical protein